MSEAIQVTGQDGAGNLLMLDLLPPGTPVATSAGGAGHLQLVRQENGLGFGVPTFETKAQAVSLIQLVTEVQKAGDFALGDIHRACCQKWNEETADAIFAEAKVSGHQLEMAALLSPLALWQRFPNYNLETHAMLAKVAPEVRSRLATRAGTERWSERHLRECCRQGRVLDPPANDEAPPAPTGRITTPTSAARPLFKWVKDQDFESAAPEAQAQYIELYGDIVDEAQDVLARWKEIYAAQAEPETTN